MARATIAFRCRAGASQLEKLCQSTFSVQTRSDTKLYCTCSVLLHIVMNARLVQSTSTVHQYDDTLINTDTQRTNSAILRTSNNTFAVAAVEKPIFTLLFKRRQVLCGCGKRYHSLSLSFIPSPSCMAYAAAAHRVYSLYSINVYVHESR